MIDMTDFSKETLLRLTDDELTDFLERYHFTCGVERAVSPDEFHHILKFTPPDVRELIRRL